ncbi:Tryptophan synthase [Penicillium diatomitis]|uniref:tryptophan synthase n=1 Tax=Penicillium diatomitis TaxID=2819901 RepID=A0A9W9WQW5_9EURO|nr:Tryptophan synthase [Penicillium diatomitis]KAJ5472032.1 Tryptophan synthase [Penicillium diatomitis]
MSSVLQKYYVSPGSPPLGGRYVPELMIGFLERITIAFESAMGDNAFWKEVNGLIRLSSPQCSPLYQARKITDHIGGATLWMKREDLEHFGSHKAWNITGQLSLAKRMGCKEVVTDCASTKHGKFTALMCAHLNLKCVVIIGADDAEKQENGIHEIEKLGATVLRARCLYGAATLRTAIAEAFRYAALYYDTVYYLMGGVSGPHPIPGMTATFQQRLGAEVAKQFQVESKDQPDALVAAVGTGTGAVGLFRPFIDSAGVRLVGVESAGASPLTKGQVGVLHGAKTLVLQNDEGQILDSNCISPDLNITVVGPEVANWKINGRVEIYTATDEDARRGLEILSEYEDIKAGLDCSHAVIKAMEIAKELGPGKHVILLVTGDDEIDI